MPEDRDHHRRQSAARSPRQEGPSLLFILLLVNVVAFAAPGLAGASPAEPAGMLSVAGLRSGEWWTVFTHLFIHNDPIHLISNLALLWLAGRRVLADTGPRHFLHLYFGSGLLAAAVSLLLHPASPLLGASGCVAGVMGAYAALHPDRSVTARLGAFFPRLSARNFFFGVFFAEVILEAAATATEKSWNIPLLHGVAHAAHATGLITGWLYARHLAPGLDSLYQREDFFPQGLRRRRKEVEALPMHVRGRSVPEMPMEFLPEMPPEKSNDEFLREAVDPVLDKLYAHGMGSLTEEERAVLNEAANRFSRSGKKQGS
ncbi:MAG: rhomboid family intramembrane serine protease [Verrucomicrobiota bacterium]